MANWSNEIRNELRGYKVRAKMQGLAQYIAEAFSIEEQDKLIEALNDPKLEAHVELNIKFTERPPAVEANDEALRIKT